MPMASKWFKIPGGVSCDHDVVVKVDSQEDEISLHQQASDRGWDLIEMDCAPAWYLAEQAQKTAETDIEK